MDIKNNIQKVRKSKDGKVLIENFLSLSLLQVAGYIFPLLTLPYLARVIGVDKFGEIAFASAIIIWFQTVVDWGFNFTATRDIAKNRDDLNRVSEIFSNVMWAKLFLLVISTIILAICIYSIPYLYERRALLWLTFLYVPGHILFPDWFFQAIEKMKYVTILNVISKAFFTIMIFVVVKTKDDYIYQPLLTALGFFISGGISVWFILKKFKVKINTTSLSHVWNEIRKSWNMFVSLFLPNLYTNFSIILLGTYGGQTANGIYSGGTRFISLGEQFLNVLSRTFFPFLARRIDKHSFYVKMNSTITILAGIVLFFSADLIVKIFYTPEFAGSATVIRIMSVAPFFLFLMNAYGTNYLVLQNKENILRNIILFCSIGGFLLSWLIVTQYSYIGASITITLVWGIRGCLTWFFARKIKKNNKEL